MLGLKYTVDFRKNAEYMSPSSKYRYLLLKNYSGNNQIPKLGMSDKLA
jgi:hypothetical protein